MLKTLIITALFATSVVMKDVSSHTEDCIGEFCFTMPGSNETRIFEGAESWCMEHNSTFAVVNDSETQAALTQFLKSSTIKATAYINMKLYQHGNTWFLLNGTTYEGAVENQKYNEYTLYGYLKPNPAKAEFLVEASKPVDLRYPICDFEGTRCQNKAIGYFFFEERCYVKYDNETFTWFKARERCIKNGGDLAQFQYNPVNKFIPPFNTSWLNMSLSYWVGIRCNDSSWKYPDNATEVTYTSWFEGKPNTINYSCVCVDSNDSNSACNWTDCSCFAEQQFICLKIVPTTTVITTSPTSTTMTPTTTKTPNDTNISGQLNHKQITGLAVGLGGAGLIMIIIVIIVLAVVIRRRKWNSNESSESRPAAESNSENNNHNKVTGSDGKDLYSQVNKPPRKPTKDVYTEVNKHPKNQVTVNNDVYAEVVSDAKQQTNKADSSPEIVYSAPEFTHDAISVSPYSNYEVAARVKEPDMVPTLPGQTRSIFPTRYANDKEDAESN